MQGKKPGELEREGTVKKPKKLERAEAENRRTSREGGRGSEPDERKASKKSVRKSEKQKCWKLKKKAES